jgi:hypothetical protein
MIEIPNDKKLDTRALGELFLETQNSYKHLLFGFLLQEIPKRKSDNLIFYPAELRTGMLKIAEFPALKCNLSLGSTDQAIAQLLNGDNAQILENDLLRWVPYRLLRPFFREQLKNRPDAIINQSIVELADKKFESPCPPLYRLSVANRNLISIEVHKSWQDYLVSHFEIIDGWRRWHWATYLQRRNPSALNVMHKLEKPVRQTHELNKMRAIWREMLEINAKAIKCTYSKTFLTADEIVVDHYLPWSYLGHDQLWNLCPTDQRLNSQKSDILPSVTNLNSLASIQHKTLVWFKTTHSIKKWELFSEEYLGALQISEEQLLDESELKKSLERTISPHYQLAKNMGFKTGWQPAREEVL